ncbi:phage tail fiber protein [Pectobacterium brasiliense]
MVTERISTGQYRVSGCLGLNADLAWGGLEGGITDPRGRNGLERLWIDYDIESDGAIVIRTYHRTHPNAMSFARNDLKGYEEGQPIDIPADTFLSIRVQMPERGEVRPVATHTVSHSNVYCNSVSPA